MSAGRIIKEGLAALFPRALVTHGRRDSGRISLTFDDGPHPAHTPRILQILAEHRATATFFLQGHECEQYPDLVRAIAAAGHEIGSHGYHHLDARAESRERYVAEAMQAHALIEKILGRSLPRLFRPPYGNVTPGTVLALVRRGFQFVFWTTDTQDSFIEDRDALVAHVARQPIAAGDILLLHEDYAHTVAALPDILEEISRRSLGFGHIGT
jgi:peptidoglycan/xylan/chitin deacetylase (PgdA/CDA1 family)